MQIGLFIPCYIDQLYPQVGMATVDVLENQGVEIDFPTRQTCCGQPMANTGCISDVQKLAEKFFTTFKDYEYVVCPSGSCVAMVRHHYDQFLAQWPGFDELKARTFELCEFLVDVLKVESIQGNFPHRVGIHQSCHGLRGLQLARASELIAASYDKSRQLLEGLYGIQVTSLSRPDECCGFGGTFSINEPDVSASMGVDRLRDHQEAGSEIITAADMSCLMHLDGLIRRNSMPLKVMHVAEILAGYEVP